jgi:hypothetical protein
MKYFCDLLLLTSLTMGGLKTSAQMISLTATERANLTRLLSADAEARQLFQKLQREADRCVADPGQPVVRIQTGGRTASDPAKMASRRSLEDMKTLHALAYVYAVTGKAEYRAAVQRIVAHWAEVNQPTGRPIDETKLEPLFVAYDLIRAECQEEERRAVDAWLRKIAEKEQQSGNRKSATSFNNWNSHRLKIVGLIGFVLADRTLIDWAVASFKRQIEANLEPDGSSYDFHERDALHYHCYNLEPLLSLALAAERHGIHLYHYEAPDGASLPKAVAFLVPYCRGEKTHAEWVHSKVEFDRVRADAGEKKFVPGTLFEPREASRVLELASYFDPQFRSLALSVSGSSAVKYSSWQMVLNDACR